MQRSRYGVLGMPADPDQLAAIPLLASLSNAQRRAVASLADSQSAPAGTTLVGEGSRGHSFFVLVEGTASVTVGGEQVATLGPGDFFGEIALHEDNRRTASVTTTSPASVIVMHGSDFEVLERDFPEVAERLRQATRDRFARG